MVMSIITMTFAARNFSARRGASDEHTLQRSGRSEQRSLAEKPLPQNTSHLGDTTLANRFRLNFSRSRSIWKITTMTAVETNLINPKFMVERISYLPCSPALAVRRLPRMLAQQFNHVPGYGKDHLRFPRCAGRRFSSGIRCGASAGTGQARR